MNSYFRSSGINTPPLSLLNCSTSKCLIQTKLRCTCCKKSYCIECLNLTCPMNSNLSHISEDEMLIINDDSKKDKQPSISHTSHIHRLKASIKKMSSATFNFKQLFMCITFSWLAFFFYYIFSSSKNDCTIGDVFGWGRS